MALLMALTPAVVGAANNTTVTFENVTFSDGTTGVIEASSKTTNKSTVTVCEYYAPCHVEYLGQFERVDFASSDAASVEQFCDQHFADRQ